jgi:uncharacterized protein (DUF305 family)
VRSTAIRGTAAAVLLSAVLLGLAGCVNAEKAAPAGAGASQSFGPAPTTTSAPSASAPTSTQGSAAAAHNAADITFLDQAVQLRQQAINLATKASTVSTNAQIRTLATQIANDAVPSVDTMTGLLTQWGQPSPSSVPGQIPGLLSDSQVQQIEAATGTPFDMQWLQGVKGNLTAAEQAATNEASKGSNPTAKQLAQQWATQLKTELNSLTAIAG